MYIPKIIIENSEEIRELDVDDQDIDYNIETWRNHIEDIDDILDGVGGAGRISRRDLFALSPPAPTCLVDCTPELQEELRRYFILVMVWGYGEVGYGPYRVSQMITSANFPAILCEVSTECFYGNFLKAYNTLIDGNNINMLGPAFASKYLTFYCNNILASVKPLILDRLVIKTMRTFDWPGWCVNYMANENNPKTDPQAYGQYLILMHNWAHAIKCRPDQLELFLWEQGKRP